MQFNTIQRGWGGRFTSFKQRKKLVEIWLNPETNEMAAIVDARIPESTGLRLIERLRACLERDAGS